MSSETSAKLSDVGNELRAVGESADDEFTHEKVDHNTARGDPRAAAKRQIAAGH